DDDGALVGPTPLGSAEDVERADVGSGLDLDARVRGHEHLDEAHGVGEHDAMGLAVENGVAKIELEMAHRHVVAAIEAADVDRLHDVLTDATAYRDVERRERAGRTP